MFVILLKKSTAIIQPFLVFPMPHPDGAAFIMLFGRQTYLKIVNHGAKVPLAFTANKVVMLSLLL